MAKKCNDSTPFTKEQWQSETDPAELLSGLISLVRCGWSQFTNRRFRLFGVAVACRIEHLLPDDEWRQAVRIAERCADEPALFEAARRARYALSLRHSDPSGPPYTEEWNWKCACVVVQFILSQDANPRFAEEVKWAASWAISALTNRQLLDSPKNSKRLRRAQQAIQSEQVTLLRDIFDGSFRTRTFSSAWRTETVTSLAHGMYESRDFSAMPILADALQDAGCEDGAVLDHCRDPHGVPGRGGGGGDLVLGKS